jgi:hypothetical protein
MSRRKNMLRIARDVERNPGNMKASKERQFFEIIGTCE